MGPVWKSNFTGVSMPRRSPPRAIDAAPAGDGRVRCRSPRRSTEPGIGGAIAEATSTTFGGPREQDWPVLISTSVSGRAEAHDLRRVEPRRVASGGARRPRHAVDSSTGSGRPSPPDASRQQVARTRRSRCSRKFGASTRSRPTRGTAGSSGSASRRPRGPRAAVDHDAERVLLRLVEARRPDEPGLDVRAVGRPLPGRSVR